MVVYTEALTLRNILFTDHGYILERRVRQRARDSQLAYPYSDPTKLDFRSRAEGKRGRDKKFRNRNN